MALHIVTSKCFLTCEKVTFIKLEEFPKEKEVENIEVVLRKRKPGRPKKNALAKSEPKIEVKIEPAIEYRIMIGYYPITPSSASNYNHGGREPSECTLEINLSNKQKANALYAEIVREVQEQHPNEGYLDKLVNKILDGEEFKVDALVERDN